MNQTKPIQTDAALTTTLLQDLADPRLSLWQICESHALALDQLAALLGSPGFRRIADSIAFAAQARLALLAPTAHQIAIEALMNLAAQEPQSRAHAETVRKATTTLLKLAATADPPAEHPPETAPTDDTTVTGRRDTHARCGNPAPPPSEPSGLPEPSSPRASTPATTATPDGDLIFISSEGSLHALAGSCQPFHQRARPRGARPANPQVPEHPAGLSPA